MGPGQSSLSRHMNRTAMRTRAGIPVLQRSFLTWPRATFPLLRLASLLGPRGVNGCPDARPEHRRAVGLRPVFDWRDYRRVAGEPSSG